MGVQASNRGTRICASDDSDGPGNDDWELAAGPADEVEVVPASRPAVRVEKSDSLLAVELARPPREA